MNISALYRSIQPPAKERKTSTSAEFIDYVYNAEYVFGQDVVVLKETFTDKETKHIRQNENTLRMEKIEDILQIASSAGFILQGKTSMKSCGGDENQYLYVFERSM